MNESIQKASARVESDARRYLEEGDSIALAGLTDEELREEYDGAWRYVMTVTGELNRRHGLKWADQ